MYLASLVIVYTLVVVAGWADVLMAVALGAALGGIGRWFRPDGLTWLWCALIGFGFGFVALSFMEMTASFIGFGPVQVLAPALGTLILYRGAPRIVGITVLSLLAALFVACFAFLLVIFSHI